MPKKSAACLCGVVLLTGSAVVSSQTFNVVRTFSGYPPPYPFGKLASGGNTLYVATMGGGTSGSGSVFRVKTDGTGYAMLKSFSQTYPSSSGVYTNTDGAGPLAGLVLGGDTLYGTTYDGGRSGKGTVFSLKTDGSAFAVLRHFAGSDGKAPYADLLLASNVLYGTTAAGGVSNKGTVFRLNTDGSGFEVLKSFAGSDGLLPLGGLALSEGTLYGTTLQGGAWNRGTVFSIQTDGTGFATLKEFTGADGSQPRFTLILSGSALCGTTEGDGDLSNSLVFRLNTDGTDYTILKTFSTPDPVSGTNSDGYYIRSGLASSGGALFGTTRWGGNFDSGVIFALRTDGSGYTVLRHFSAVTSSGRNSDGATPFPSLMLSDGTLYGTTESGGGASEGTLFSLNIAPQIQVKDSSFGIGTNGFGFNISGYSNQVVAVESCANLAAPSWVPLQTNTIGDGLIYFVDPDWKNYTCRFYRVRME
jgi:uncharacterized repeat protein (TIGR03803 family)